MVPVHALWLPILVSAVIVFIVSSILHTVLTYHQRDLRQLPREDEILAALRPFAIPPGDYAVPRPPTMKAMKSPEYQEKYAKGPVAIMTVVPNGAPTMGSSLVLWFLYSIVVGVCAAYVAGRALPAGSPYRAVFRFAGCTAFLGYSLALLQNSIWYRRSWGTTFRSMFDGLLYGLLTAGTFGWLWPR